MKNFILPIFILASALMSRAQAQVGINTKVPASTLDIIAKNTTGTTTSTDGLLVPRVDRQRAQSMTSVPVSTMVYINSIGTGTQTGTAANIDAVGYYYYNGTVWIKLGSEGNNIYTANGTLAANRTVSQEDKTLAFTGTAVNAFSVDGNTFSVDAANNFVGVGTSSPQGILHVVANNQGDGAINDFYFDGYGSSSYPSIYFGSAGGAEAGPTNLANGTIIGGVSFKPRINGDWAYHSARMYSIYQGNGTTNLSDLRFDTSSIGRMIITPTGNVGIGTTTPTQKLHVIGNILASGSITPSDIRIKKDIADNTYGLKEISKLRTITYKYKDENLSKDKKVGFVAQEIKETMPELVTTANDQMKTLGVNYAEMTVVLTKAVQELKEIVNLQQDELNQLKSQLKHK